MSLESLINKSNSFYYENDLAVINKKATPIKIVNINNETKEITKAFFEQESTVDYCGIYRGKYLEFEAKSTMSKTSFNMYNFEEHQIKYFKKVMLQNALCFVIIQFSSLDRWYLVLMKDIFKYIDETKKESIPLDEIMDFGYEIKLSLNPPLNYLKIIDKYLF